MTDEERLEEIKEQHKRANRISDSDIEWLVKQAEKVNQLKEVYQDRCEDIDFYVNALRKIDTHIRSTREPVPYIIDTLKSTLPEYQKDD